MKLAVVATIVGVMATSLPAFGGSSESEPEASVALRRVDLVLVVDTTHSMVGNLEALRVVLRSHLRDVPGETEVDLRIGMVAYRDWGEVPNVRALPLSHDRDATSRFLESLEASGGGDWPEAVSFAMFVAVSKMNWDLSDDTDRRIVLFGDAPAHDHSPKGYDWKTEVKAAVSKGIRISTIAPSKKAVAASPVPVKPTPKEVTALHKQWELIATKTGGEFVWFVPKKRVAALMALIRRTIGVSGTM